MNPATTANTTVLRITMSMSYRRYFMTAMPIEIGMITKLTMATAPTQLFHWSEPGSTFRLSTRNAST